DHVRHFLRPSSQPSHLKEMIKIMNHGAAREKTRLAPIFHEMAERITRRALVVVLSDLFDETADLLAGLKHLRHKRHEVVVFHVLDAAELGFPFQEAPLFRGLEQFPELWTDPKSRRQGYLDGIPKLPSGVRRRGLEQNA